MTANCSSGLMSSNDLLETVPRISLADRFGGDSQQFTAPCFGHNLRRRQIPDQRRVVTGDVLHIEEFFCPGRIGRSGAISFETEAAQFGCEMVFVGDTRQSPVRKNEVPIPQHRNLLVPFHCGF